MTKLHFLRLNILTYLILFGAGKGLLAQTFNKVSKVNFMYSASAVSKSLYVRSNLASLACTDPEPRPTVRKAILNAVLNWKGDYDNVPANNTQYNLTLSIQAYSSFTGSSGLLATYNHNLTVNTNKPQSYIAIDFTGLYTTANRFVVTATYATSGAANPNVQSVVQTDVYYTEEFDYDVSYDLVNPMFVSTTPLINQNEVTFKWSGLCGVPAPNYQFQLLKLYNTDINKTGNEADVYALIDWNKALTIETGNSLQEITLTMAEGNGYYLWRVRPIGNAYEGGIADDRNWGVWTPTGSYTQGNNYAITNSYLSTTIVAPYLIYYVQPTADAAHNWIFSRQFMEGDALNKGQTNIGEGISYANGLQMVQQVQTKLSSEDKILSSQTIYDYSGRPALNTLAAPVNQGNLGYISSYIRNTSATNYTADDFDTDLNFNNPSAMDMTNGGPGQYYSGNNTLESDIPTAEGHAYSRILYMRDGTSKPKEQSGPGLTHKLGNTGSNRHTTRHYNSGVASIELITVFGDEAPDANSVAKTITTDANNQSSITYVSKEGQTIATCLSGPPPSNLDPLPSLPATPLTVETYLDNNAAYGDNGLIASKNIVLTEPTNVYLTYNLTPNAFLYKCLPGMNFCATCDYKITITIIDNDNPSGTPLYNYSTIVNPTSGTGGCSGTPLTDFSTPAMVNLPAGSYTIQRIIEAYQINTSGNLSASPVPIQPNQPYIDQYIIQLENAIRTNFSSGNATIVDDFGVPTGAPAVSMNTLWSYLNVPFGQQPNLDALYTLLNVTTQDHVNLKINCDIITIPIKKCASNACPPGNNFEQYLMDWCTAKGLSYSTVAAKIIPGYAAGEFNTVIANMIDPLCGNYNCEALFKCWQSVIASYESLEGLSGTSLSASTGGMSMPPGSYTPNYLDMFLSCAGYKIIGISSNLGGAGCSNPGYKFHPYAYFNYGPQCLNCEKMFYAAINGNTVPYPFTTQAQFITYFNSFTSVPYAVTITNSYGTVTVYPKDDFRNCIKICNTTGGTVPAGTFEGTTESACKTTCEERYGSFVNQLVQTYHQSGQYVEGDTYTLVFDAASNHYVFSTTPYVYTSGAYISWETIYCQAQKLVEACKTNCNLTTVTTAGQTSLGTPAEIQAMANAMYGAYDISFPTNQVCPQGYTKTNPVSSASFVNAVVSALNQQLAVKRNQSPNTGFYWDYKAFLDNDFSAGFSAKYGCTTNTQVFVHPDIPSYFDFELVVPGTYRLVYYFNKQSSGQSGITPKVLYSSNLITAASPFNSFGFNYISSNTRTGNAAVTELLLSGIQAYHMGTGFSVQSNAGTFTALDINGGLYNGSSTLYYYQLSGNTGNGYYKVELCNSIREAALSCNDICYKINGIPELTTNSTVFQNEGITFQQITCEQQAGTEISNAINSQMGQIISNTASKLKEMYRQTCINQLSDELKITYDLKYHHYTLYYYDRAGNLVKTVPPKGVVTGATSRATHPAHTFVTEYAYNSLKQLTRQKTPDGGETFFWYDTKGRIRFSQNAKQLAAAKMAYTKYDELNRIYEVGEMPQSTNPTVDANNLTYPTTGMTQIVRTFYSVPASGVLYFGGKAQRYLQNRVSYAYSDVDGSTSTSNDRVSTYYSYDPHGNVEWLIQDIPDMGRNYIAYEYDLISGSVVKVKYNEAFPDRFFHRYSYDIDKRLKTAETSKDDIFWEKEACYHYYLHGPLKRVELGHDKIQGMDYAYTLQGWLKSMNHIEAAHDPGKDGNETGNSFMPKDIYGMILGYYDGDYISKTSRLNAQTSNPYHLQASAGRDLFNGNISTWSGRYDLDAMNVLNPTLAFEDKTIASGRRFEYDELNRIKKAQYATLNPSWSNSASYLETFGYDANGNITNLNRVGYGSTAGVRAMDNMTYNYYSPGSNNLLKNVTDAGDNTNPLLYNDIKSQTAYPNNYSYDAIGNLIGDQQEGITSIDWNLSGKISKIVKTLGSINQTMEFMYDATGQRVAKKVYDHTATDLQLAAITTYYVRDGSGNPMAIYKRTNSGTAPNYTAKFDLQEQPVYGSGRIGERTLNNTIFRNVNYTSSSVPAPQNLPAPVHISAWPKISIPLSNTTGKQLYTRQLNANSSTNLSTDLGVNEQAINEIVSSTITLSHGRHQAMAMDESGNIILSAYAYQKSNTGTTGYPRLYAYSNQLIGNASVINANPTSQSVFVRKPGSAGEYYYITIGNDNKPYYHVIDLTTKLVTSANNLIENVAGYGQGMAVIDDRVGDGNSVLYLRTLSGTTTSIKTFNITSDGIVSNGLTPITFSSDATGPEGELQISANGLKMAVANTNGGIGEVRVFDISSNHQTLTYKGRIAMNATTSARHVEFTANDVRIYFTQRTASTNNSAVYYVPVNLFTSSAVNLTMSSATLVNSITAPLIGAVRRGSNNNIYYTTNTTAVPNTLNIHMITNTEATPSVGAANTIATIITNGSLPLQPHVIDYQLPNAAIPVRDRNYRQKVYEVKDHLENVHSTIFDYKIPQTDGNVKWDKRFDNATTEGFAVAAGSPGGTTVSNLNNSLRVVGTLNSTALVNLPVASLPASAGNRYILSFDYIPGTAAAASYCMSTTGSNMVISGNLNSGGRYSIPFSLPTTGTTGTDIRFICQDPLTGKDFYIDNVLIKSVASTLNDAVVVLDHTGITPSGWTGSNGTVNYSTGNINLLNGAPVTNASISKNVTLVPGMVYKIAFTMNATSLGTGTPKLSLSYTDNSGTGLNYKAFITSVNGSAVYEYYITPEKPNGTLSFVYENGTAQAYNFTVNNLVVTQYQNQSKALYVAAIQSLQDYYAFGMQMPGKGYSGTGGYRYGFNGQEKDDEVYGAGNLNSFEYRIYNSRIGRFMSIDPHSDSYPNWNPYNFVFDNPLVLIDPDGRDPIYGKNFWGNVKLIGDDGKKDNKSYLVRGKVKRDVKSATKEKKDYTGDLTEGKKVIKIPTGQIMDDVIQSVTDTEKSQMENGGHANIGDAKATRWDEGPPATEIKDEFGNVIGAEATLRPFMIGGVQSVPADASNVEFWWHTHPNTTVGGILLGSSNPSEADMTFQAKMQKRGFKGNTFVIGVRSKRVTFYNKDKALITVKYSDFKKMGGK